LNKNLPILTLYYDGQCPLCQAEIIFLSKRNDQNLLNFVDIHSSAFEPVSLGVSCEQALAAMYGKFEDGELIQGAPVFAHAYRRAGLPWMAWFLSIGVLQPVFRSGYRFFAKNRHRFSKIFGDWALRLVKK
jgi:predicted DCC family thiol-disulfide oxidoreductase YuxK